MAGSPGVLGQNLLLNLVLHNEISDVVKRNFFIFDWSFKFFFAVSGCSIFLFEYFEKISSSFQTKQKIFNLSQLHLKRKMSRMQKNVFPCYFCDIRLDTPSNRPM